MIIQSYFARQPIFDRNGEPHAFEVLYRPAADAEHADVFVGPSPGQPPGVGPDSMRHLDGRRSEVVGWAVRAGD